MRFVTPYEKGKRISTGTKVQKQTSIVKTWTGSSPKDKFEFWIAVWPFGIYGSEFFRTDSCCMAWNSTPRSLSPRATVHCIISASLRWLYYRQCNLVILYDYTWWRHGLRKIFRPRAKRRRCLKGRGNNYSNRKPAERCSLPRHDLGQNRDRQVIICNLSSQGGALLEIPEWLFLRNYSLDSFLIRWVLFLSVLFCCVFLWLLCILYYRSCYRQCGGHHILLSWI